MGIIMVFILDRLNIRCEKKNLMFIYNSNEGEVFIIFRG